MRAFAVEKYGDAAGIVDLPIPEAENEYLIRVTYAGVNPIDYKMVDRLKPDSKFPYILGADFAGVVEKAPIGIGFFQPGEYVFGMARSHGAYAEYTSVPTNDPSQPIARISDELTDQQAAALPIPAITALGSVDWLKVSQGQSLIIFGATGAVGGYAVQIARAAGAKVIAIVRGDEEEARALGAHEVYNSGDKNLVGLVRETYPDGVDAILDLVNGPDKILSDIELIKENGRLVSTIYAADEHWFTEQHVTAHNIAGQTNPFSTVDGLIEVGRLLINGTITTRIQVVADLNTAGETLEKLKTGGIHGKVLLKV
jgi:NADPH2:quinone reductase